MTKEQIVEWLKTDDEQVLEGLWRQADQARQLAVGDDVHLRGLLEISNYCVRSCQYCGLRVESTELPRYRMPEQEIMDCVGEAVSYGYGTVVMQAGEDFGLTTDWISHIVRRIKTETDLAVTLSLGERSLDELAQWRKAGADRYLLRFETSKRSLFERIHPSLPGKTSDRIDLLKQIKSLGYETGSGVMIGIPGQTWEDLAEDILLFRELDLDMIGVGPFIAHGGTPLGHSAGKDNPEQVPNTELMTYKVIALTRLVCPLANIPSTSALATLNLARGRELGLARGANIVMPNLTPKQYRPLYEIYPAKACIDETAAECRACMHGRIRSVNRNVGIGRGDSPNRASGDTGSAPLR
jgi:biotin synthase